MQRNCILLLFWLSMLTVCLAEEPKDQDYDYEQPIEGKGDMDLFNYEDELCENCRCYNESSLSLWLDCTGLGLEKIPDWLDEFENQTFSILLDLSFNTIEELVSFPEGSVWNLDLSHNSIRRIENGAFIQISQDLMELDLSDNKLDASGLEKDCFRGKLIEGNISPLQIIQLSLAKNRIHTVHPEIFVHLTKLTDLDLSDNPLEPFSQAMVEAINGILTLESLNFRSTGLTSLPEGMLTGMDQLIYLDLSGNRFHQVSPEIKMVPFLETLILNNNLLHELNKDSFNGLVNLKNLSISECHGLKYIEEGSFASLTDLQLLRISGNKQLEWISPDAWPKDINLPFTLQELDLSDNHLNYLPNMLLPDFTDWKKIEIINIQGNPWVCDCHNEWMLSTLTPMIHEKNPDLTENLVCGGPVHSVLVREQMTVVHELTHTNELPCDTAQFNPWIKSMNLPNLENKENRTRKSSLPTTITVLCIFAIIGSTGMVGMLYVQRSKENTPRRYRNDVPAPFVGYTATSSTHPPGQPGLPDTHAPRTGLSNIYSPRAGQSNKYSPPAGQNALDLEDVHGIVNTEFRDDEGRKVE
ncbi:toll-like receptor 7 [Eurytemora carolleeae]|uniref:toll-like receptor 7 n=1 Tax=Eurytemora carolleeae TaxID=1294199 RepID=UPI000C777A53|nr:toll-like receptor 7 [Eurytemora carolleeae]|eukprot:XP_023347242.1 toll-like receptor 7 [Eurytemora affinis]